jgi:hypothetical protein
MSKNDLRDTIAKAIKKADNSVFFENYSKQASAVMAALEREGYALLPKQPDEAMLKIGVDNIPSGRLKPEQLVSRIYQSMVQHALGDKR